VARKPVPYLFVAMTPQESEDLKGAARGLIYGGQVPVHVTIGDSEFTTRCSQGRALPSARHGCGAPGGGDRRGRGAPQLRTLGMTSGWNRGSLTTRSSRSRWSSKETPRTIRSR
jgi:hypothetical protein